MGFLKFMGWQQPFSSQGSALDTPPAILCAKCGGDILTPPALHAGCAGPDRKTIERIKKRLAKMKAAPNVGVHSSIYVEDVEALLRIR